MAILSEGCKPGNFEPNNSLKLAYKYFRLSFRFCWLWIFFESNSPDIFALCEANVDDSIDSGDFSVRGYPPFYYSYTWSCSLCERRTFFCTGLISRKLCGFLLLFSSGFTSLYVTSFSSINHLLHRYARFLILFHVI